jgi:hypothetical protein
VSCPVLHSRPIDISLELWCIAINKNTQPIQKGIGLPSKLDNFPLLIDKY